MIDSEFHGGLHHPMNACCYREQCKAMERALAESRAEVAEYANTVQGYIDTIAEADAQAERLAGAGRRVTAAFRAHGEATPFTREGERTRRECEAAMLALDALLRDQEEGK